MVEKEIYEKIKPIIDEYLKDKIGIYRAAEKIVDTLFRWETHYLPLLAYHEDPWAAWARDIQLIEDLLAVCGEISDDVESFILCVTQEIVERFFKQ